LSAKASIDCLNRSMVYLLCFGTKFKHAKHYIGYVKKAEGLEPRMEKHRKGTGSKLMAAVSKAGIGFQITRLWANGDQNFERYLKNKKNAKYLCPCCTSSIKPVMYHLIPTQPSASDASNSSTLPNSSTAVMIEDSYTSSNHLTHKVIQLDYNP
jgi:hypothetical protein